MPQLGKGGKWVFGWAIIGSDNTLQIPPAAYQEYGFSAGETIAITRGSRRSGGFGLGKTEALEQSAQMRTRIIDRVVINHNQQIRLPVLTDVKPGERFLVVRGSCYALGFLHHGPIVELAQQHTDIEAYLP